MATPKSALDMGYAHTPTDRTAGATLTNVADSSPVIRWKKDVVAHDFDAAEAYLSIRLNPEKAKSLVKRLRDAPLTQRRANDILRASGREALPLTDPGVLRDLELVARGQKLSPVLVVSFDDGAEIADGYHRVSLTYALDPFGAVPVRIATLSH